MKLNTVMMALEEAEKKHKEQQVFWDTFDEIWPVADRNELEKEEEQYCLHDDIDEIIFQKVVDALKKNVGNRTHAAKELGIKRETLLAKMKKYCLI